MWHNILYKRVLLLNVNNHVLFYKTVLSRYEKFQEKYCFMNNFAFVFNILG